MKQWMIWVGAGVIGVILAFLLIPWGSLTIDSTDQTSAVPTPRAPTTAAVVGDPVDDPLEDRADEPGAPGLDIDLPSALAPDPGDDVPGEDEEAWVNPAREVRNELLRRPDMVLIRQTESRWRSLVRVIEELPHDGAADHTMGRIDQLRKDLAAYRRSPDDYDMDELIDRQRSIFSELKQTSYWTPQVQSSEAQLTQAIETYLAAPDAPE